MPEPNEAKIPIESEVDVLILGGSSGAVACALEAAKRDLSVFLAAPRPYLGEDICAPFDYWSKPGAPSTPMQVKLGLEQSMVQAGIPFLLNAHPAAVLRDAAGRISGALIAHRGGVQAVAAACTVDASTRSLAARQAGWRFKAFKGRARVRHVTLGGPTLPGLQAEELEPMPALGLNGEVRLPARAYYLDAELDSADPGSPARAHAQISDRCWAPGVIQHSEWVDTSELDLCDEGLRASGPEIPLRALEAMPGLFILGRGAPLPRELALKLGGAELGSRTGARLGAWIAPGARPEGDLQGQQAGALPLASGSLRLAVGQPRRGPMPTRFATFDLSRVPRLGRFDVAVVGGGTGGAPAAISAARAGARVLVAENLPALGGVGTQGQISIYYYGNRVGFTDEVDQGVAALEPRKFPKPGTWTPAAKQAWLLRECLKSSVEPWLTTACAGAWVEEGGPGGATVKGVLLAGPMGFGLVEAGAVVDATGNADVAAAAGAATTQIGAGHMAVQGTGIAGIKPGRHYHNTDHTFSDDSDAQDATQLLVAAKRKFRDHFDCGQLIDSRERRQIVGEWTLDPYDFMARSRYADTICVSSSNFDSHGYAIHPLFLVKPPDEDQLWVELPLRCLLPRGIEGLLVTGLGISAHRDAIPVVRMQPDVQNQGYAAGRAAAMSAASGQGLRRLDLRSLQRHLVEIGNIPKDVLRAEDSPPPTDAELVQAIAGGWDSFSGLAVIFRDSGRSLPLLRAAFPASQGPRRLRLAQVLGLMGDPLGAGELIRHLKASAWDQGWSYRGMGQFGASVSPVDACLMALGASGEPEGWEVLLDYAAKFPADAPMSHARALAEACESLYPRHPRPEAGEALARLLGLPGVGGHAQRTLAQVQAALTADPNENGVRERALREIHLARGAFACGHPRGAEVLGLSAADLRGAFARHAQALLSRALPAAALARA